mmetsp:Transcript_21385/g.38308  ORF Transcript_21385/g.38308 Transcript_21385/m.38308 type:complete len:306 (+) Transcript_21385:1054-1971(+)
MIRFRIEGQIVQQFIQRNLLVIILIILITVIGITPLLLRLLRHCDLRLENIHPRPHLPIGLQLLHKVLLVQDLHIRRLLQPLLSAPLLLLLVRLLNRQTLQLEHSLLRRIYLPGGHSAVQLPHEDHVGKFPRPPYILGIVVDQLHILHIVPQSHIPALHEVSQLTALFHCDIVRSQIALPRRTHQRQLRPLLSIHPPFRLISFQKHRILPQYDVSRQPRPRRGNHRPERIAPIRIALDGTRLSRQWVDDLYHIANVLDEDETCNVSNVSGEFFGEEEEIVLAEGAYFDEVGEFVVGDVGFVVGAY